MKTAYATLKGLEVIRALKRGQAAFCQYWDGIAGEVRLVERAFGLGPSGMAEAIQTLNQQIGETAACASSTTPAAKPHQSATRFATVPA